MDGKSRIAAARVRAAAVKTAVAIGAVAVFAIVFAVLRSEHAQASSGSSDAGVVSNDDSADDDPGYFGSGELSARGGTPSVATHAS
jgi:hypothetical protein